LDSKSKGAAFTGRIALRHPQAAIVIDQLRRSCHDFESVCLL